MNTVVNSSNIFSDFWLNNESLKQYIPENNKTDDFSLDLIQLATYRRIVSNFVFLLTHLDIPVQFCLNDGNKTGTSFTDGSKIFLSATIKNKKDFDWSVGIALHEASHILLTDFNAIKTTFNRIPIPIPISFKAKTKQKNLTEEDIAYLCKWVWNFIEDRFVDTYVFNEAPGYRGYYKAMYDKFWNSDMISKALKSRAFRLPNLISYEYRILNLTNQDTDLDALPALREIAELIDISNISRLKTTTERIDLSYKVAEMIVENISKQPSKKNENTADSTIKKIHEKLSGDNPQQPTSKPPEEANDGKGKEKPEDKPSSGQNDDADKKDKPEECSPNDGGDLSEFSEDELKDLKEDFDNERDVLEHDYQNIKEVITSEQSSVLDAIEKSGIVLVPVGRSINKNQDDFSKASIDCVVVRKLTKELIDAGPKVFPYASKDLNAPGVLNRPLESIENAVLKGFSVGKVLGKKLQIRGEENAIKYIRKPSGKIERRLLADIGAGSEHIFNKTVLEKYNKARLHISVDASGSMTHESKWCPTMTCVVAICVAASMVENLEVSVSFRSSVRVGVGDLPYIALVYDSKVDKISKVRNLFPYLRAGGATPEGLAFEAIMDEFIVGKKTSEQDHYFLNISDGEPYFTVDAKCNKYNVAVNYTREVGARHTKMMVDKIRSKGVNILSYFIEGQYKPYSFNDNVKSSLTLSDLFLIMYGKDAQYIDVENVMDIAKTINKLFLSKV